MLSITSLLGLKATAVKYFMAFRIIKTVNYNCKMYYDIGPAAKYAIYGYEFGWHLDFPADSGVNTVMA